MPPEESEVERRARRRLGTTLRDKYRLDRVLGTGGMAVVYRATHRNPKQFAVKMLHPELSERQGIRTRFLREGSVANSFKHAGAVAVLDDDVADDGSAFLVMKLLEGDDLDHIAQKNGYRLPVASTLALDHRLDRRDLCAAPPAGFVRRRRVLDGHPIDRATQCLLACHLRLRRRRSRDPRGAVSPGSRASVQRERPARAAAGSLVSSLCDVTDHRHRP